MDCGLQALPPEACELSNLQLLGLSGTMLLKQKSRATQHAGCCNLAELPLHKVLKVCMHVCRRHYAHMRSNVHTHRLHHTFQLHIPQPSCLDCSDSLPCCSVQLASCKWLDLRCGAGQPGRSQPLQCALDLHTLHGCSCHSAYACCRMKTKSIVQSAVAQSLRPEGTSDAAL